MFKFIKEHKACQRLIAIVLVVVLAIMQIPSIVSQATENTTYEVGDYKGDKSEEQWTYPTDQPGKVFAGWYTDDTYKTVYTEKTGSAVAKFVDEKVLTVKVQLKKNTALESSDTNIRFITAIDSLRYDMVEFDVQVPESNKKFTLQETTAYSSILVDENELYPYSANEVFETDAAKYFVVHSITGIPNAVFEQTFNVTPYWYTLDGTKVAGTARSLTVDGEVMLPFADKVTIGENEFVSALDKWDLSEVHNNTLIGTKDSSKQTIYFKETGNTALLQTTVDYTKGFDSDDYPLYIRPRFIVTDGASTDYYNIRIQSNDIYANNSSGTRYENTLNKVADGSDYHVLRRRFDHPTIQFDVALQGETFYVYVDNVLVTTIPKSEVVPNAAADTELAFGLDVSVYGSETGESTSTDFAAYEIRNVEFTTNAVQVDNFIKGMNTFSKTVTVNGKTVSSAYGKWDTSALADGVLAGSLAKGSNGQPMYFTQTGNTALLQTEVAYTTDFSGGEDTTNYQLLIKPRLIVTDGTNDTTNYYYIMLHSNDIRLTGYDMSSTTDVISYHVLRQGFGHMTIQLDIALLDGYFYVYIDDVFVTKIEMTKIVPNATSDTELAFGLDVHLDDNTRAADYEFRNIRFTTLDTLVNSYMKEQGVDLIDKKVSILGDSLSTYAGVSNNGTTNTTTTDNNAWYNTDKLTDWKQTYWGQTITKFGMELLVNNSCGGNMLTEASSAGNVQVPAGKERAKELAADTGDLSGTTPDIIFMHMGTNDYFSQVDAATFKMAYSETVSTMISYYANAKIYCFTLTPCGSGTSADLLNEYNTAIREVVTANAGNGVVLVDVASDSKITADNKGTYTFDGTHYNALGIAELVQVLEKALVQ